MLGNILSGSGALVGVGEAYLEHIVLTVYNVKGGCRRSDLKDPVAVAFRRNCDTGLSGNGAEDYLHAPILKGVVSVNGFLCVVLIILKLQLKLSAAEGVDLVNGDLSAVLNCDAVGSSGAGKGADAADLECSGACIAAV